MLASISPLGERARGNRWGLTAAAYASASIAAGAVVGAVLGSAGAVVGLGRSSSLLILSGAAVAAGVWDLTAAVRLPTWRRQVNEDWLARYRGWVYGLGFGAQLGVGVVTVVTTATMYAWMVGAFLAASPVAGAGIGAAFGAARALPLVLVAPLHTADALRRRLRQVAAAARTARVTTATVAVGVGVLAGVRA